MDVRSLSSLRVGSLLWQPRPPTWELAVVCKATFALMPGTSALADEQEAINEHDDHWDDDPARGVRAPGDLVPGKLRADVTLVGNAYAPGGKPVRSLTARMLVGDVDKSIEVWCDRTFLQDGTLQEGPRFTRMRLTWERAAGGPGTMNPAGVRHDARDAYNRRALPNLQPIGIHVSDIDDFIEPVGFGPIAASWPTRAERRTMPAMQGGGSQPESSDLAFYNAAPLDQQPETLRANERIVLENLHPQHARLVTNLPGIKPAALVERGRGAAVWLAMRPDTLWIDADRGIATLTWRGRLPLARPDEPGRVLVALEEADRKRTIPDVMTQAMSVLRTTPELETEAPTDADDDDDPFMSNTVTISGPIPDAPAPAQGSVMPFKPVAPNAPRGRATQQGPEGGLPFQRAASPGVPPSSAPRPAPSPPPPPASRPAQQARPAQPSWSSISPPGGRDMPPPAPVAPPGPVVAPPVPIVAPPPVPGMSPPAPVMAPPVPVMAPPAPVMAPPPVPVVAPAPAPVLSPPPPVPAPAAAMPAFVMPQPVRPTQPEMARPESPWALGPTPAPPLPDTASSARDASSSSPGARGGVAAKDAGEGGALGASNEAAAAARPWTALRRDQAPVAVTPAADEAVKPMIVRELLQLVWFDAPTVPRIRRVASWKKLLEELAKKPADKALDDPMAGKEAWEVEDRRELLEVLANGDRIDGQGAQDALLDAVRDDGKYAPPLALFACELETPFDEIAALKATVTVAAPLAGPSDESLRTSVEAADKFLTRSNLESAPAAADGLSTQIREAFAREKKGLPEGSIDGQVERAMLAGRHYQKRDVLGDKHLRALVWLPEEQQPLVAYVPQVVANRLPLAKRFRARLIAEIHPSQDPFEKRDEALRVLALATISVIKKAKSEPRGA